MDQNRWIVHLKDNDLVRQLVLLKAKMIAFVNLEYQLFHSRAPMAEETEKQKRLPLIVGNLQNPDVVNFAYVVDSKSLSEDGRLIEASMILEADTMEFHFTDDIGDTIIVFNVGKKKIARFRMKNISSIYQWDNGKKVFRYREI